MKDNLTMYFSLWSPYFPLINNIFGSLDWLTIHSSFKRSTFDTNLKWFQYRILCRILTTNDYLYERKVNDSDRCSICKTERETIRHLLWDCTYTETLWRRILDWVINNTSHLRAFNITEQLVIFGVEDNVVTDRVLELKMLMAKHYIFRCRCLKVTPNFVKQRAVIEKHIWLMKNNLTMYFSLWTTYFPLINDIL